MNPFAFCPYTVVHSRYSTIQHVDDGYEAVPLTLDSVLSMDGLDRLGAFVFVFDASHSRQRVSPVKDIDGRPIVVLTARRWPEEDDEWLHMLIYALEVGDPLFRTVPDFFGDDFTCKMGNV